VISNRYLVVIGFPLVDKICAASSLEVTNILSTELHICYSRGHGAPAKLPYWANGEVTYCHGELADIELYDIEDENKIWVN